MLRSCIPDTNAYSNKPIELFVDELIYSLNQGDYFLKSNTIIDPKGILTASISEDRNYLIKGTKTTPLLTAYSEMKTILRSLSGNNRLPNVNIIFLEWTHDKRYLAVGLEKFPYLVIYHYNGVWTRTTPSISYFYKRPEMIRWSKDGKYITICGSFPYIKVYKNIDGDLVETTITGLLNEVVYDVDWSHCSEYFTVCIRSYPYALTYRRYGDVFIRENLMTEFPRYMTSSTCSLTKTGYLVIGETGNPNLPTNQRGAAICLYKSNIDSIDLVDRIYFESGSKQGFINALDCSSNGKNIVCSVYNGSYQLFGFVLSDSKLVRKRFITNVNSSAIIKFTQ